MKKTLLFCTLLATTLSTVNAQSTSFEASEGYTLGNINGQNGWIITGGAEENSFITDQLVSNEQATQGTQSLKIVEDEDYGGQSSTIMGAFRDFTPLASTHYSVSADYYLSELQGANFGFHLVGATSFIARFEFNYTGNLRTVESNGTQLAWSPIAGSSWQANTWYNVKIEVDGTVVRYYINNTLVRTGATAITEQMEQFRFAHDNYGGFAYIDNVVVTNMLSKDKFNANSLSVFPNPSNGIVNISNTENVLLNNVSIMDLNGRTVKNVQLSDVAEAQINISGLSAGVYMMNISSDQGTVTKKIVKN